jgi:hypothetical protein
MVLPSSGLISLLDIQNEFGGTNPIGINEYYRNGGLVPGNNTNVPTSGIISLADFYGAVNEIVKYITSTSTNVNASSYFTAGEWSSSAPKRLVINAGVTVGATNTSNYALNIPSGFGGTFRLDNNGSIQGAGGAANSGTGGSAIFAGAGISINNVGTIYAGGGGGGLGGTGGQGVVSTSQWVYQGDFYRTGLNTARFISWPYQPGQVAGITGSLRWDGQRYNGIPVSGYLVVGNERFANAYYVGFTYGIGYIYAVRYEIFTTTNTITNGGTSGAGGRGRGYDGALSAGSAGSAGGTNAGTGGTGGTGGDWGTSGNTGSAGANGNSTAGSAGTAGGLAGFYVVNNGNVNWIANGTRAGRVG